MKKFISLTQNASTLLYPSLCWNDAETGCSTQRANDRYEDHLDGQFGRSPQICIVSDFETETANFILFLLILIFSVHFRAVCNATLHCQAVISYHVGTLKLGQLVHENGDPHIISNNYLKSALRESVKKYNFLQMISCWDICHFSGCQKKVKQRPVILTNMIIDHVETLA